MSKSKLFHFMLQFMGSFKGDKLPENLLLLLLLCKSTIVCFYTQRLLMRNGKNAVRSGDICVLRVNATYLRSAAYAAMHAVVSSSERASASQMPLSPSIFGSRMKLGTRNTAPRSSANIIAGRTRSTLWK